jgi:protein CpxP
MTPTRATPALLVAAGLVLSTAAWAQTGATPAPSGIAPSGSSAPPAAASPTTAAPSSDSSMTSPAPAMHHHRGMHAASANATSGDTMQTLVEKRITQLHSRLKITDAQGPQWDQFTQVMRANARDLDQSYQARAGKLASMTAPENMQSFADLSQQRAQDMEKLVPAFQTLYASLSDDQKRAADQMFRSDAERAQAHQAAAHP